MSMQTPVNALLALEKLNGENSYKWKSNLNLMLVSENHKFVLTEECPEEHIADANAHMLTRKFPRRHSAMDLPEG